MSKVIVLANCGNGYCGCDSEEVFIYEAGVSEKDINEDVHDWAVENAESYAHVHFGWDGEYSDEEYEEYIENHVDMDWHIADYEEYVEWCENWGYEPKSREELGM